MNADELRLRLLELLRDELDVDAELQGKRIVVRDGHSTVIVLCTAARIQEIAPDAVRHG